MDSSHLTPAQFRKIRDEIQPTLGYLSWMKDRMEETRFPPHDQLDALTLRAQDALQALFVKAHYGSCQGGVGRLHQGGGDA